MPLDYSNTGFCVFSRLASERCDAVQRGEMLLDIHKSIPFQGDSGYFPLRVLCCRDGSNGLIDTEYMCSRYNIILPGELTEDICEMACLSKKEIARLSTGQKLFVWHIDNGKHLTMANKSVVTSIRDFGLKKMTRDWQHCNLQLDDGSEGDGQPTVFVHMDEAHDLLHWSDDAPKIPIDRNAEYFVRDKSIQEMFCPEGRLMIRRKDGLPYKGSLDWLVRPEELFSER